MYTDRPNHEPSLLLMNTGDKQVGRPSMGSWLTYGLGSETQNLPAYVALTDPHSLPVIGVGNWSNGWLPTGTRTAPLPGVACAAVAIITSPLTIAAVTRPRRAKRESVMLSSLFRPALKVPESRSAWNLVEG